MVSMGLAAVAVFFASIGKGLIIWTYRFYSESFLRVAVNTEISPCPYPDPQVSSLSVLRLCGGSTGLGPGKAPRCVGKGHHV